MLEKLLELNKRRMENLFDDGEDRYIGAAMYVEEMQKEIVEMTEELRSDNVVYLEDELGDIMRDYLCLLRGLEHEWLIDSVDNVWQRSYQKLSERLAWYPHQDWNAVKKVQKERLRQEHEKRYG